MKKLLAFALALVLCFACTAAFATELQQAEITVDAPEGRTIVFEDLGISFIMPEVLVQTEVSEENAANGVFDCYQTADQSATLFLAAAELQDDTIENMVAALQANEQYTDVGILTINGISFLVYTDTALNQTVFAADMASAGIMFCVYASPADDEGYIAVVTQILGSIALVE